MPNAGYCEQCGANVWLTADGECLNGHPASSVSNQYQCDPLPAQESSVPEEPVKRRMRWWVVLAAIAVILTVGWATQPLIVKAMLAYGGWDHRVQADYPGWMPVGINYRSFSSPSGSSTVYTLVVIPPDRRFSVPVAYDASKGQRPTPLDEVFRPAGKDHAQAKPLLDFIDANYVQKGKALVSVEANGTGTAVVTWQKTRGFGPFSFHTGSFDELTFDEGTGFWKRTGGVALPWE